jgi:hypothetical protein
MVTRYLLRRPKAGLVLLAGVPLVDVVMLVAGVIDLHNGAAPSYKHSLAAIFIGCSVGFGHQTIAWAIGSGLMLLGTLLSGGLEKSGVLLQPAVTWTIVLVVDGFVSFSYSLDGKSEHKQSV